MRFAIFLILLGAVGCQHAKMERSTKAVPCDSCGMVHEEVAPQVSAARMQKKRTLAKAPQSAQPGCASCAASASIQPAPAMTNPYGARQTRTLDVTQTQMVILEPEVVQAPQQAMQQPVQQQAMPMVELGLPIPVDTVQVAPPVLRRMSSARPATPPQYRQ